MYAVIRTGGKQYRVAPGMCCASRRPELRPTRPSSSAKCLAALDLRGRPGQAAERESDSDRTLRWPRRQDPWSSTTSGRSSTRAAGTPPCIHLVRSTRSKSTAPPTGRKSKSGCTFSRPVCAGEILRTKRWQHKKGLGQFEEWPRLQCTAAGRQAVCRRYSSPAAPSSCASAATRIKPCLNVGRGSDDTLFRQDHRQDQIPGQGQERPIRLHRGGRVKEPAEVK